MEGLAAKDVIDIQVTVSDLENPTHVVKLEEAGFRLRTAVAFVGRVNQRYALLFRDYLRTHSSVRRAYELVKRQLAEDYFPADVDGYYSIKDPFMDVIFLGAEYWAAIEKWSPNNDYY